MTADIVNPAGVKEGTYTVEFFEHEVPGKALNTATVEEEGNVVDPLSAVEAVQKVGDINASVITYSVKRDDAFCLMADPLIMRRPSAIM